MLKTILKTPIVQLFLVFFTGATLISLTTEANDSYGIIQGGKILIAVVTAFTSIGYAKIFASIDSQLVITSHISRVFYRGVLLSFFPIILLIQSNNKYNLWLIPIAVSSFYVVFDEAYNISKGDSKDYIGDTSKLDILARKIFGQNGGIYYEYTKIFLLIVIYSIAFPHYAR